ncbi:hypothetical protein CPLU01_02346 [Colletotrichum plurivorum]|uniref:Uncharacterized protein n=1 Tax=Colletotrichum plurivorum TaxID=2175906 RepID=A0A8H6KWE3_9PEZI|nr:hypothetical protein CPLU01_02346 [Colletotrichum plurivorum]
MKAGGVRLDVGHVGREVVDVGGGGRTTRAFVSWEYCWHSSEVVLALTLTLRGVGLRTTPMPSRQGVDPPVHQYTNTDEHWQLRLAGTPPLRLKLGDESTFDLKPIQPLMLGTATKSSAPERHHDR